MSEVKDGAGNYYDHVIDCLEAARNRRFCAGAEQGAAEIKRLTNALVELQDGCDHLHKYIAEKKKRIERLEAAVASVGLSTPLPQSAIDLIYECRQLMRDRGLEPTIGENYEQVSP